MAAAWCLVIPTLTPPIDWPGTIAGFVKENVGVLAVATAGRARAATTSDVDASLVFMPARYGPGNPPLT